jgi:hypothetical protein
MAIETDSDLKCHNCNKKVYRRMEVAGVQFCAYCVGLLEKPALCPHGNDPCECDACFKESDFAYDSWREGR